MIHDKNNFFEYTFLLIIFLLCLVKGNFELYLLLIIGVLYTIAIDLYNSKKIWHNIFVFCYIIYFGYALVSICKVLGTLKYTFILEFIVTIIGIINLYIIIDKIIPIIEYYLKNKISHIHMCVLYIIYFLNILVINKLLLQTSLLSTIFIIFSILCLLIYIYRKKNLLWSISRHWIQIILIISSALYIVCWFILLFYRKYIIAIIICGINLNIFAWKILKHK